MKKGIFTGLILTAALAVFGAACQTATTVNTNSSMNSNAMNRNSMMTNSNSMSNMPMNGNSTSNSEMSKMSGDMMMKSDANAASAPYDLQFIDTMSAHHKSAVDMAEMALTNSQNAELKAFAQKIITDQKKEIATMKDWREKWFAGKAAAMNMEMPGMMDSMKDMKMSEMQVAKGKEFDLMFLEAMTKHHTGAVVMAKDALTKAEKPEIKTMANNIIKAQEAEIKQMADWKAKWSK